MSGSSPTRGDPEATGGRPASGAGGDRSIAWKLALAFAVFAVLFLGLWVAGGLLIQAVLSPGGAGGPSSDFPDRAGAAAPDGLPDAAWTGGERPAAPRSPLAAEWIALLGSPEYEQRRKAEDSLVELGDSAVPDLEQALSHADPEVRWRAREALRRLREKPPR
jgi:hypothetical protein